MNAKFYVDVEGNYIGSFDGVNPPVDAIEVPAWPDHAAQKWDFDNQIFLPLDEEGA